MTKFQKAFEKHSALVKSHMGNRFELHIGDYGKRYCLCLKGKGGNIVWHTAFYTPEQMEAFLNGMALQRMYNLDRKTQKVGDIRRMFNSL